MKKEKESQQTETVLNLIHQNLPVHLSIAGNP